MVAHNNIKQLEIENKNMKKKTQNINNNSPPLLDTPIRPSLASLPQPTVPAKYYPNSETSKEKILKENKNKSGIYRFKNLKNDKRYVGSALDLSNRLLFYYSPSKINSALQQGNSYICSAIIKYGLNNFSLEILEYCEPEKLLIREKYYIDFGSEYNIIKDPTLPPMSGRKHSNETKIIMSDTAKKRENHPMSGKNHSDETKIIMSDAKKGEKNPMYGKNHSDESKTIISDSQKKIDHPGRFKTGENNPNYGKKVEGSGKPLQVIEVSDIKNNITTSYNSINEAATALNIKQSTITNYILRNQQKPYKGIYTFKKV